MRFAINVPNFAAFADTRWLADLAHAAEDSGWDGFFIWDHILPGPLPVADPWLQLAAIAVATSRIKLGPMVTPLPRRRPEQLARQAVSLDHLSGGRLILGLGLGDDSLREYSAFDGPLSARVRAEILDEGLDVLAGLWSGEPFSFEGRHFRLREAQFLPRPLQQPRIPVWLAARWPAPAGFLRASRWDGVVPQYRDGPMTPAVCRDIASFMVANRDTDQPFDIAVLGWSRGLPPEGGTQLALEMAAAGATWFQVSLPQDCSREEALDRVHRGPPRI